MAEISYVSCRLSTYPEDRITVGIIYIDGAGVTRVRVSDNKMRIVEAIMKKSTFALFNAAVRGLEENAHKIDRDAVDHMVKNYNGLLKVHGMVTVDIQGVTSDDNYLDMKFNKIDSYK